jgi:succinyl-CoA synthetase beta subunit
MVVRLDGTNAEEGRLILADAGIPADRLISQPTMLDAARKAVAIANADGTKGSAA